MMRLLRRFQSLRTLQTLRMLVASCGVAAGVMAALPSTAFGQETAGIEAGRRLYANCSACHGTDGKPAGDGALPPLAGQPKQQLIAAMQAFKAGERQATIMHQIARGYSDDQIALIAGYLESQSMQNMQKAQKTETTQKTQGAK